MSVSATKPALGSLMKDRDPSLDFSKGILVEVMMIFHGVQYFADPRHPILNYLAFVTGAFVFLAGSVITEIYLARPIVDRARIFIRLLWRSLKMLLLFSTINILFHLLIGPPTDRHGITALASSVREIFGTGNKSMVAYEMLVPIAYTLVASSVIALLIRSKAQVAIVAVAVFVMVTLHFSESFNLRFLGLGILGMSYGLLKDIRQRPVEGDFMAVTALLLTFCYFLTIVWFAQDTPWIYAVGVVAIVELIREIRLRCSLPSIAIYFFEQFGRYSLFGYISQIVFFRALLAVVGHHNKSELTAALSILLCNAVIFTAIAVIISRRRQISWFDRVYRAVLA